MSTEPTDSTNSTDAAASMLTRLREFAETLSSDERAVLAALLAPGIALAYPTSEEALEDRDEFRQLDQREPEVVGHSMVEWSPTALPEQLARQIRARRLRIEEG